jgi:hypothetical protein
MLVMEIRYVLWEKYETQNYIMWQNAEFIIVVIGETYNDRRLWMINI